MLIRLINFLKTLFRRNDALMDLCVLQGYRGEALAKEYAYRSWLMNNVQ